MSQFSGAVQLTDLNDFISPSQECIKPVGSKKRESGSSVIKVETDGSYFDVDSTGGKTKLEKVEITLNDCLACSGCVTSAEAVLVNEQSVKQLKEVLKDGTKMLVMSMCTPAIASLAAKYQLSVHQTTLKVCSFFRSFGFHYVYDLSVAHDLCLRECVDEFLNRYKRKQDGDKKALPMLTSACPGWVCYTEKTHGDVVLPFMSKTKSPQQISGSLIKKFLTKTKSIQPSNIYHVTLMPCYDKKLEASRLEFFNDVTNSKDVDCVITPLELQELFEEQHIILNDILDSKLDEVLPSSASVDTPVDSRRNPGSASGGYLEYVLKEAAQRLHSIHIDHLEYKVLRNKDIQEVSVMNQNKETVLKFALAYGFRNIQNIVQKIKRRKITYDFVEVMACPKGCLNGGGQIRGEDASEVFNNVQDVYNRLRTESPGHHQELVDELFCVDNHKELLHTTYHKIEADTSALSIKW